MHMRERDKTVIKEGAGIKPQPNDFRATSHADLTTFMLIALSGM